jgi:hypothetical protein
MISTEQLNHQRIAATLPFRGRARLLVNGHEVKLRRKGLALLYYVAIEGPTRRELLAHLLWGRGRALQNLRVELHRLKQPLEQLGIAPFADYEDPLELSQVSIDSTRFTGDVLGGLDDISPVFQEWLERQRSLNPEAAPASHRAELIDELARDVTLPFVLVVVGEPGSGRRDVAQDLAAKLRLPLVDGCAGTAPSVNFISLDGILDSNLATTIERSHDRLWVLERSIFGEDPEALLQLRARIAPERMRFVRLEPLRWWEVKGSLLQTMTFTEGARLFQAALGNSRYLAELQQLRGKASPGGALPVPLTIRAAFALEARKLSAGARRVIEGASVHSGPLTTGLLTALGVDGHLAELEAGGWLTFDGATWRFTNELARRMLADLLPEGTKHHLRALVGEQLRREKAGPQDIARLGKQGAKPATGPGVDGRTACDAPVKQRVVVTGEVWLDEPEVSSESVKLVGDKVIVSRTRLYGASEAATSRAIWGLDEEPLLLRLRGKAYLHDEQGPVEPSYTRGLTLRIVGSNAPELDLCRSGTPARMTAASVGLPLTERFDYWIVVPAGRQLQLASNAPSAVIEFRLSAYRYQCIADAATGAEWIVDAYALEEPETVRTPTREPMTAFQIVTAQHSGD